MTDNFVIRVTSRHLALKCTYYCFGIEYGQYVVYDVWCHMPIVSLIPPHTNWCVSPVNGEYQHWLQPVALIG
jgi:hypothetical protein